MGADEWDGDASGDAEDKSGEAAGKEAVSGEEAEILAAAKRTGMSPAEMTARARRDYERDLAESNKEAEAAADAAKTSGGESGGEDDSVLTRGEARTMMSETRRAARIDTLQVQQQAAMQTIVGESVKAGLGEAVPAGKHRAITAAVAERLQLNAKAMQMSDSDFKDLVKTTADEVVKDEVSFAKKLTAKGSESELANRLDARQGAAESGPGGGSRKRSAKPGETRDVNVETLDAPHYGISQTREWPTDEDIEEAYERDLETYTAEEKAGRTRSAG